MQNSKKKKKKKKKKKIKGYIPNKENYLENTKQNNSNIH